MDDVLYVVTCISNPQEYKSRYRLYNEFKEYMSKFKNVILYTVELAIGDQEFKVTNANDPTNIQLRGDQVFWHKENLLNIGISQLPADAKYVAWIDADTTFLNPHWARDTIAELKKHKIVQMFSEYINLGPKNEVLNKAIGFIKAWKDSAEPIFDSEYGSAKKGVTGLAWAARMETLDQIGGLLDWMIVGSSDWYMAYSLIGESNQTNNRMPMLQDFQLLCDVYVGLDVGYVNGCAVHYFHGPKSKRFYDSRWRILTSNKFDPAKDLTVNDDGLYIVNRTKTLMLDQLIDYFKSRDEDALS